jgi:hypothetical protein
MRHHNDPGQSIAVRNEVVENDICAPIHHPTGLGFAVAMQEVLARVFLVCLVAVRRPVSDREETVRSHLCKKGAEGSPVGIASRSGKCHNPQPVMFRERSEICRAVNSVAETPGSSSITTGIWSTRVLPVRSLGRRISGLRSSGNAHHRSAMIRYCVEIPNMSPSAFEVGTLFSTLVSSEKVS